jgi:hypothetical protein
MSWSQPNVHGTNLSGVGSFKVVVEWIAILVAAAVVMAGALALVAAIAGAASDRVREGADVAQAALWAAGFSAREEHLLATTASVARAELGAGTVEVVLAPPGWSGDGIVVTGSRLAPERLGAVVVPGTGTAGRAIATGRTALAYSGSGAPEASNGLVAVAVPIAGLSGVVGVVAATAVGPDRLFSSSDVGRLELLAAQTGRQVAAPLSRMA